MEPLTLSDDAVLLRPWAAADAEFMYRASLDPAIQRYNGPVSKTVAEAASVIARIDQRWQSFHAGSDPTGVAFAICDGSTGDAVGMCGVDEWSATDVAQFGYWLAASARGQGFATRAVRLMTDWLLGLGAARVFLTIQSDNTASAAVARRAGFIHEETSQPPGSDDVGPLDVFAVSPNE